MLGALHVTGVDTDETEAAAFWAHQSSLPLRQRDGMWWLEVVFPTVVICAAIVAAVVLLVVGAL